jgi:hypothetical protein
MTGWTGRQRHGKAAILPRLIDIFRAVPGATPARARPARSALWPDA